MCYAYRSLGIWGNPSVQYWLTPDRRIVENTKYHIQDVDIPGTIPSPLPLIRQSTMNIFILVFDGQIAPDIEVIHQVGKLIVVQNINAVPSESTETHTPLDVAFPELELPDGPNIYLTLADGVITKHIWIPEKN